jgi:predicted PurR-regulated permease PerM
MKIESRTLAYWLVSGAVLMALLVYGAPMLVPLVFALLAWAILNALADVLESWRFPNWLAWVSAFAAIVAALYFVALVLANEVAALAAAAPEYGAKLQRLWNEVPFHERLPTLEFTTLLQQSEIAGVLTHTAASLGNLLLELVLVAIYVGFLLAEQRHLPAKLARIQSSRLAQSESEQVIDAIGAQIRSYIGVCTLLSVAMGTVCYIVLILLGVDFAGFWALLMFLLTYIPTVGGLGVALPALMALAQFGEIGPAIIVLVVLGLTHFFLTNVIETIMLGRSLNLSPFAIIVSLTFWGLIWGVAGLFLAVPITGAIAIACRHLEGMGWVAELIAGPPPRPGRWRMQKLHLGH